MTEKAPQTKASEAAGPRTCVSFQALRAFIAELRDAGVIADHRDWMAHDEEALDELVLSALETCLETCNAPGAASPAPGPD
jgi:hypothetical protein